MVGQLCKRLGHVDFAIKDVLPLSVFSLGIYFCFLSDYEYLSFSLKKSSKAVEWLFSDRAHGQLMSSFNVYYHAKHYLESCGISLSPP
jgi:hypothetical protein